MRGCLDAGVRIAPDVGTVDMQEVQAAYIGSGAASVGARPQNTCGARYTPKTSRSTPKISPIVA